MPKRFISRVAPAAFLVAFAVPPAAAQHELTITASPNPNETVAGVTMLAFRATVPQEPSGERSYRVVLGPAAAFTTEVKNTDVGSGTVTLTFSATYKVPPGAEPGDKLCFILQRYSAWSVGATPVGGGYFPVDSECRTVSTATVSRTTTANEPVARAPLPAPSVNIADQPPATAARAPLPPPDLALAYEKAPEARWVVSNIGQGPAPATVLRLSRAGLPDKDIAIPALAAAATFAVVVTPELDDYLVNAKGMVDPDGQVTEPNEVNNIWQSVQSR